MYKYKITVHVTINPKPARTVNDLKERLRKELPKVLDDWREPLLPPQTSPLAKEKDVRDVEIVIEEIQSPKRS